MKKREIVKIYYHIWLTKIGLQYELALLISNKGPYSTASHGSGRAKRHLTPALAEEC